MFTRCPYPPDYDPYAHYVDTYINCPNCGNVTQALLTSAGVITPCRVCFNEIVLPELTEEQVEYIRQVVF